VNGGANLDALPMPLVVAARAASQAYDSVIARYPRSVLENIVATGADGTPTMMIDAVVEEAIVEATAKLRVNILSEEIGFVDRRSALTLVVDPLDGSANAAAGVPLACFSAALVSDSMFTAALTIWFDGHRAWGATADASVLVGSPPGGWKTTGRTALDGGAVSLLRPHAHTWPTWQAIATRAARVRILSCSTIESALVLQGSTDAFVDAGSDTHRLVDLAAAMVLVPLAGGVVCDLDGRSLEFDIDLTRRWSGVVAATSQLAGELCAAAALARDAQPEQLGESVPPLAPVR
jgi:myo-inositol-1(or 4)-monophosphatase